MNESILTSIKKMLGITSEYQHFDPDIIMHINTVLMILTQIGVGPSEGFSISDDTATWNQFTDCKNIEAIKSYVALKVRLLFDPPSGTANIESIERLIKELEWRINIAAESN